MKTRFRRALKAQAFQPPRWAVVVNPFYIIRRALFKKIAAIAPQMTGTVIDLGCGSKPYETLFVNAAAYIGVDIQQSGHDHVDSEVDIFYDGKTLPFEDATIDNVVSFETFEHIFNIQDIASEVFRVLAGNGTLLISVPFAWDEHETPYDYARYTTFGIVDVIRKAGFQIVAVERTNNFVAAVSQLAILYFYYITRSRIKLLNQLVQVVAIFPMTIFSLAMAAILPKRDSFYSGIVLAARKPG